MTIEWVSYAVKSPLVASVGHTKLMPPPPSSEEPCLVINSKSGHARTNTSWVIGRLLRDYESWMDSAVRAKINSRLDKRWQHLQRNATDEAIPRPRQTGLCVSVYEPSKTKKAGEPAHDLVYWSGIATILLQLVIAALALFKSNDSSTFLITISGTYLALTTGSLSQWKAEKWACRRKSPNPYILTGGNGAQHAIMILGNGHGLHLEDLTVRTAYPSLDLQTRFYLAITSLLWVVLLLPIRSLRRKSWPLLVIAGMGTIQNVFATGVKRAPSALGVHLDFVEVVGDVQVMDALIRLEAKYPNAGRSLLPTFFPGGLRAEEMRMWSGKKM
ncbi:MAG: hypothetical protein Q9210_004735 [Variospora velana]